MPYNRDVNKPQNGPIEPIRFYTEDELDALEAIDPDRAYRIARAQAMAQRQRQAPPHAGEALPPPDPAAVKQALEDVRHILQRDGGDIELVDIQGPVVRVRMKGACVGCPNSVLDLKNVVEKVLRAVPGVTGVQNTF